MKRLMIYSKHSLPGTKNIILSIKNNGENILLVTLFLCGLIIGSSIVSGYTGSSLINIFKSYIAVSTGKRFIMSVIGAVLFYVFSFCAAFSCTGFIAIALLPCIKGIISGVYLSLCYSLSTTGETAYIKFAIIYIIGVSIGMCVCFISSLKSMTVSKTTAAAIFSSGKERIDVKSYITVQIIFMCISVAALGISAILELIVIK